MKTKKVDRSGPLSYLSAKRMRGIAVEAMRTDAVSRKADGLDECLNLGEAQ